MKEPAFSKYVKDLKESLGFMKEPLFILLGPSHAFQI
jgi:hypothetical protein